MLLNLALEYVNQLNASEPLTIFPSFEKVVQIEAKDFTEELFESVRERIQSTCSAD